MKVVAGLRAVDFPDPPRLLAKVRRGDLFLLLCLLDAVTASSSRLHSDDVNIEPSCARNLLLKTIKQRAAELLDPSALETSKVYMVPVASHFVVMLLPIQMHQIQLIHQPQFLK